MKPALFLIFNHTITPLQRESAGAELGVGAVTDMPDDLKALWRQVPPDLADIEDYLAPVRRWLADAARPLDFVLIQGDFGAVFHMVNVALGLGLVPVYSTTARDATESIAPDGTVSLTHAFRHVRFRRYR